MDAFAYAQALRREGTALADAPDRGLDGAVPGCPGWMVADVVRHTGEVHRFWPQVAGRRLRDPSAAQPVPRPPDPDLVAWFCDGLALLVDTLEGADPTTPVWTWSNRQEIGFAGIDEFLDVMLPGRPEYLVGPVESIYLHAADADAEWVVHAGDGRVDVARGPDGAPVTVAGSASDLLLLLWRRLAPEALDVAGDPRCWAASWPAPSSNTPR
jgi:hypothetical protein